MGCSPGRGLGWQGCVLLTTLGRGGGRVCLLGEGAVPSNCGGAEGVSGAQILGSFYFGGYPASVTQSGHITAFGLVGTAAHLQQTPGRVVGACIRPGGGT